MRTVGAQRTRVALGILAITAGLAWTTMDAGKVRAVVLVILAGFALRIALAARRQPDSQDLPEKQ